MDRYRVYETASFLRDLESIEASQRSLLERKLKEQVYVRLRIEPHVGPQIRKLREWRPDTWRYRFGAWRCFYEIDERDRVVAMTLLKRRSEGTYSRGGPR